MGSIKADVNWAKHRAVRSLNVIVVGAGVGGLAAGIALSQTGHRVTILEKVQDNQPRGYGMAVGPNMYRILDRWGVSAELIQRSSVMKGSSPRRYAHDEKLGDLKSGSVVGKYGWPMGFTSRPELLDVLLRAAENSGVKVLAGKKIVAVDEDFKPRVKTADGEWFEGDLVIAADGLRSSIRRQIVESNGHKDVSLPTGDAAYYAIIPQERMERSERVSGLAHQDISMRCLGPGGHIMAHPVSNNTAYSMTMIHPARPDREESWSVKCDKQEVVDMYKDWSETVRDLISFIPEEKVTEMTLHIHAPLSSWVQGRVALMGDACHPMLPYVAQGAANAVEDAAVLAAALTKTSDIGLALRVYEKVRKQRAEAIQQSASVNQHSLHLPDGPEQQARDEAMKMAAQGQGQNPDKYADLEWQNFMWGTDVMKQTVEDWEELVQAVR